MVICRQRGANELHMVQLKSLPPHHLLVIKIQVGLPFMVPAYRGRHGKQAVKRVSVIQGIPMEFVRTLRAIHYNCVATWS